MKLEPDKIALLAMTAILAIWIISHLRFGGRGLFFLFLIFAGFLLSRSFFLLLYATPVVWLALLARQIYFERQWFLAFLLSTFGSFLFFVQGVFLAFWHGNVNTFEELILSIALSSIPLGLLWLIARTPRHFDPAAYQAMREEAFRLRTKAAQEKAQAALAEESAAQKALSTPAPPIEHNRSKGQPASARQERQ
ncbi:MAG: hypothetical protein LBD67_10415 [Candidatus Accumulibacter sp.]|jgi:hypothetical protein|nr:hypothetical protein [Accumulibacter sp.]